jgi:hypothetical protein
MWKVNGQQTTDAKWWQKLTLSLARWAKKAYKTLTEFCFLMKLSFQIIWQKLVLSYVLIILHEIGQLQHYVIKFVSDLQQVSQWYPSPPPIKLTVTYNWILFESGIKYHNPNPCPIPWLNRMLFPHEIELPNNLAKIGPKLCTHNPSWNWAVKELDKG